MKDYLSLNRDAWDKRTEIHLASRFYDVPGFLSGKSSLNSIEIELLGDINGKRLLHLQCHFGLDTLSLGRMGAQVTGVDLSPAAVSEAKKLARADISDASFICNDVYQYLGSSQDKFDIVFTSYGAICWLPDLQLWAEGIATHLEPGGRFVMVEFHPAIDLLSGYSYFPSGQPDVESEGTYTENCTGEQMEMATWPHSIGEVYTALINAGFSVSYLQEFPFSPYQCFESMEEIEGKGFQLIHNGQQVPMLYAIVGARPY